MGDTSSINSSFLSPPLTPRSEHDVPYRPTETDQTSLNMKKRRRVNKNKAESKKESKRDKPHQSKSTNVESIRTNEPRTLSTDHSNRRRSLSMMHTTTSGNSSFESAHNAEKKLRRWTLPSKSTSTSVFTPLGSTVKQATLTRQPESPAMITLRRATTNRRPKKVELTFFPEPKFGNEKSGLLSYIVSTFSRTDMPRRTSDQSCTDRSARMGNARSASVGSDGAHPTWTFPAATVCTEAFVESNLAMPGVFAATPPSRRCSTKYVTGDSSYEVIWDENDNSSSTQESSRPSLTSDRRPSLAATKLEAQLAQNLQDTRRSSTRSRRSSSTNSKSSANMFLEQVITPEKLSALFPRLIRDTALRNLPRSRGGGRGLDNICNIDNMEASYQVMTDGRQRSRIQSVDFFPPLQNRRTSDMNDQDCRKLASMPLTDTQPSRRMSASQGPSGARLGSMVGSSSHTRRRSSATANIRWQRGLKNKKRPSITAGNASGNQIDDADVTPLLCTRPRHRASQS